MCAAATLGAGLLTPSIGPERFAGCHYFKEDSMTNHSSHNIITTFLDIVIGAELHGYDEQNARLKRLFHRRGKQLMQRIASDLGYEANTFDVYSNPAGVAVSGEVTLHCDDLYVQFSRSCVGGGEMDILFRSCEGRKDYRGGQNHFLPFESLRDYSSFLRVLKACRRVKAEVAS